MTENFLAKLFEHNNWANLKTIQACGALSDEQLDAKPSTVTKGSIRETLTQLVSSQRGYLALLTLPVEERPHGPVDFSKLEESARASGEGFVALARDPSGITPGKQLQTRDGYFVEPWVVMVQAINHATEHREQINSMLSSLGVTPPDLDGWAYGEDTKALVPISG